MKKKMRKQKLYGLLLVAVSVITTLIEHDATVAVLFVPLGIGLMVTKQYWLT